MAKPIQVTKWEASDGSVWDSEVSALRHESFGAVEAELLKAKLWTAYDCPSLIEVAAWLSENYTLTPKAP